MSIDIKTATAAEIEAWLDENGANKEMIAKFNEHAEKPVKRFATIGDAHRRFRKLVCEIRGNENFFDEPKKKAVRPAPGTAPKKAAPAPKKAAPKPKKDDGATDAATGNNSEGIKRSWQDEAVRAKRTKRHHVRVNGKEYRSVHAAFEALGLPIAKVIPFRMRLKEYGQLNEFGYVWHAIEV